MTRYKILLNILDHIRAEAASTNMASRYLPPSSETEQVNQARSRAFIHLYLKVGFGLLGFMEREHYVTDGTNDGGIDGYFINEDQKTIYLIQSKFRTNNYNFENKEISFQEIFAMDVVRILDGHRENESGIPYNGKILQLQREISSLDGIAHYKYRVVVLANVRAASQSQLSRLVGGLQCEVMDNERCYDELVFPMISGTFFKAADLTIHLDLSNKNAGSKISYSVDTSYGQCDITALFVPTIEIAKTFHRYKNSILKFNPRSYLELEGAKVNLAIRNTILRDKKNEFALYNNGITMLSDETNLNERIGQRNKAQLNVRNPQIINGGQTAYTLSRIYEEMGPQQSEAIFADKEVLVKVITLASEGEPNEDKKLKLIEAVSIATNQQTVVIPADRYSNQQENLELQRRLFNRYGLLFERKRGEFADGLHKGYIQRPEIIERNLCFRILCAAKGNIKEAGEKKLFTRVSQSGWPAPTDEELDRFYFAHFCFKLIDKAKTPEERRGREVWAKVYAMATWFRPQELTEYSASAKASAERFLNEWNRFLGTQPTKGQGFGSDTFRIAVQNYARAMPAS